MYKEYYGLKSDPFRLSPDHAFCYRYPSFGKGRAYMQYALQAAEGFVVVTGSPGMGKTTLINDLLADYGPSDYLVATLVNTMLEANEVLRSAAYEFGINVESMDTATVLQRLKQLFIKSHQDGSPPLLVVDEAQNLTLDALEELRMLTNLQAQGRPLLQIFLVGQEGLREKLQDPRLEQLRQRVTAAAHLEALSQAQMAAYIVHRLRVVGWKGLPKIKGSVLPVIEAACEGVPRRINQFCSRLLLHGAVEQKTLLDMDDAKVVFAELSEEHLSRVTLPSGSALDAEYLGGSGLEEAVAGVDEDAFDEAEGLLSDQTKVVMPPPRAKRRAGGQVLVPSMDETFGGYSPAPTAGATARAPEPTRAPHVQPGLPHQDHRAPYRPGRPWFSYVLAFFMMLGAGVFAWYQLDQGNAMELLGREIDAFIESRSAAGGEPVDTALSAQPATVE